RGKPPRSLHEEEGGRLEEEKNAPRPDRAPSPPQEGGKAPRRPDEVRAAAREGATAERDRPLIRCRVPWALSGDSSVARKTSATAAAARSSISRRSAASWTSSSARRRSTAGTATGTFSPSWTRFPRKRRTPTSR